MKRILMMVLRNIILVPFMWCKLCYHAHHVDKYTEEEHYKMLKFIVRRANKGGNVTIAAEGLDNIPKENGFMFFPNHQGMYDVLAIMDVCPVPIPTTNGGQAFGPASLTAVRIAFFTPSSPSAGFSINTRLIFSLPKPFGATVIFTRSPSTIRV